VTILATITLLATPGASAHSTRHTKGDLADFLEQRQKHHQYVCANGAPIRTTRWHCKALRWTHREKREHRRAKRLRYLTLPETNDWVTAVKVVQRVYPGTESWLLSCSAAEGGHGEWVRYGGGSYYAGYEWTNEVGNWLQYRWQTFKGHYRHGIETLQHKGFRVQLPTPSDVRAWLSPLATAIAGGWARWSGNDDSHWSASSGNGC